MSDLILLALGFCAGSLFTIVIAALANRTGFLEPSGPCPVCEKNVLLRPVMVREKSKWDPTENETQYYHRKCWKNSHAQKENHRT